MVNFEYYKVFYHVATLRSISQAAEVLYITQPACRTNWEKSG